LILPPCAVALFAHNEGPNLRAAVESLRAAAGDREIAVAVLLNGCTDNSLAVARQLASEWPAVVPVEIPLADKAGAWNVYVHHVSAGERFARAAVHVFTDGDVRVTPESLQALTQALDEVPRANAAGGMPITGRDRERWRRRMVAGGTLAGALYAVRGSFVARLRAQAIRIPAGLIGEDWLVSWLAGTDLQLAGAPDGTPRLVFCSDAGFSFRSLNPLRPRDHWNYARRLWRYALRGVQFEMLMPLLTRETLGAMPRDVAELYRRGAMPSRLKWVGRNSVLRSLAVQRIRRAARAQVS
jgi:glycosyltransferase involved in cell wall biosynthesis